MKNWKLLSSAFGASLLMAACGGGGGDPGSAGTQDTSGARGSLQQNPPARVTALSASDFKASLAASASGQLILALAGNPVCDVDVQYLKYGTVGGAGEKATASGVLMTPNGSAAQCSGARPIVLHAHGTTISKGYNLAALNDPNNPGYGEAVMLAAVYAAQGYIVVAPNYVGYDSSNASVHPYLNADQQSKEMIDALAAAKSAMPNLLSPKTTNGKLFLTGYSQGGHVAMATHRAMQAAGVTVTASAPQSGPYALAAMSDAVFMGNINAGSTIFFPLISNSFQKAFGNLYTSPSDLYESAYATGIDSLLPSNQYDFTSVVTSGKLPATALFSNVPPTAPTGSPPVIQATLNAMTTSTNPLFAAGFGSGNLVKNSARLSYLLDVLANPDGAINPSQTVTTGMPNSSVTNPMRKAAVANDLRGWTPKSPTLMCGGNGDPTVFFTNTQIMQNLWKSPSPLAPLSPALVTVLDVDSSPSSASDPFAAVKLGFAQFKASFGTNQVALIGAYHGGVAPFCQAAARGFFSQF